MKQITFTKKEKVISLLLLVAFLLHFFTEKGILPVYIYSFVATGLGVYFFPIKLILGLAKGLDRKKIFIAVWSHWLYAAMLSISVMQLFIPDVQSFRILSSCIALVNALTGLTYYLFSVNNDKAILHFAMCLFYHV
jgi:hypothetical protein